MGGLVWLCSLILSLSSLPSDILLGWDGCEWQVPLPILGPWKSLQLIVMEQLKACLRTGRARRAGMARAQASYTVRGGLGALADAFENWPGVGAPSLWCIAHLAGLLMAFSLLGQGDLYKM